MNKKITIVGIIVAVVALALAVAFKSGPSGPTDTELYSSDFSKFSISMPTGWGVRDVATSTNSSNVWFSDNPSSTSTGATMVVGRFVRTPKMNTYIEAAGGEPFLYDLAHSLRLGLNKYKETAKQEIEINGVKFVEFSGTYVGGKTQREVTQYLYYTLRDDAYYMIGVDAYSDIWQQQKDEIMGSVRSIRLL